MARSSDEPRPRTSGTRSKPPEQDRGERAPQGQHAGQDRGGAAQPQQQQGAPQRYFAPGEDGECH